MVDRRGPLPRIRRLAGRISGRPVRRVSQSLKARRPLRIAQMPGAGFPLGQEMTAEDLISADQLPDVLVLALESETQEGAGLTGSRLELLLACEQWGVPTLLVIEKHDDLSSPEAAVVTHIGVTQGQSSADTTGEELLPRVQRVAGTQRTVQLPDERDPAALQRALKAVRSSSGSLSF